MLSQDPRYLRCQTQWHPPFNVQQEPPPQSLVPASRSSPSFPAPHQQWQSSTSCRSPNLSLTSDPFVQMFQLINESNIKMQQESVVKQQQVFTDYLQTESTLRKEQIALMQKQLDALIALTPSKACVPPTHFQPNSVDGISFNSTVPQQDPRQMTPENPLPLPSQQPASLSMPIQSNQEQPSASYLIQIAHQQVTIPSHTRTESQQIPDS